MRTKILALRLLLAATVAAGAAFSSCRNGVDVVYDHSLDQMTAIAAEAGTDFCVVLSEPDCRPCETLIKGLTSVMNRGASTKIPYNVVDVTQAENRWYTHWLCTHVFPTTCLFSADGKLKAVIPGTERSSIDCLESSVEGNTKCADYLYVNHFKMRGSHIDILNDLLACKRVMDAGEEVGNALDAVMAVADYPWPVWLKTLDAQKHGRDEEAVEMAKRMTEFHDNYLSLVYGDLIAQAKYIINPDYEPADDAMLATAEEIVLDGCKKGKPHYFSVEVTNSGKAPLVVRDITTSCTCLKLLSPKQLMLEPGASSQLELEFTAEDKGDFYREVIFFSNAAEAMTRIAVRAHAS
jgi:hypothetical protein